jgi:hypothetical protein
MLRRVLLKEFQMSMITLYSPKPWEVFQRQTKSKGTVRVEGRAAGADSVEVRFFGKSTNGAIDKTWRKAKLDKLTGGFSLVVQLPAGGWYTCEARGKRKGKVVSTFEVETFGVGEVFVTAGQSNSTSCGQFPTRQKSGMVSAFNGREWKKATDPIWGAHDMKDMDEHQLSIFSGGSPWLAFGDAMFKSTGVPIGVVVTGQGGSSIDHWTRAGTIFPWMMARVSRMGYRGFRAILWHQGESDVAMPAGEYGTKLTRLIEDTRLDAGWAMPWFVAKVSYHSPENPIHETIRAEFDNIVACGTAMAGPDTDMLTGDNRDEDGLGIHFSVKGLTAHGRMWAKIVSKWLDE